MDKKINLDVLMKEIDEKITELDKQIEEDSKIINDKFTYKKGDIKISKSQCDLCIYNVYNKDVCGKHKDGKLKEVINNEIRCPDLCVSNLLDKNNDVKRK